MTLKSLGLFSRLFFLCPAVARGAAGASVGALQGPLPSLLPGPGCSCGAFAVVGLWPAGQIAKIGGRNCYFLGKWQNTGVVIAICAFWKAK